MLEIQEKGETYGGGRRHAEHGGCVCYSNNILQVALFTLSTKAGSVLDSTIWNLTVDAKEENKHLCNSCIHF